MKVAQLFEDLNKNACLKLTIFIATLNVRKDNIIESET